MKRTTPLLILLAGSVALSGQPASAQKGRGQGGGPPQGVGAPGPVGVPAGRGPGQIGSEGAGSKGPQGPDARNERSQDKAAKGAEVNGGDPAAAKGPDMKVAEQLTENTHLASNLRPFFPEGTDLQGAASGFKNLGQFVAAAHVSKNLDVPFDDLKAQVLGPADGSLGRAIRALNPAFSAEAVRAEVKRAEKQAKEEIKTAKDEAKLAQKQAKEESRRSTEQQQD